MRASGKADQAEEQTEAAEAWEDYELSLLAFLSLVMVGTTGWLYSQYQRWVSLKKAGPGTGEDIVLILQHFADPASHPHQRFVEKRLELGLQHHYDITKLRPPNAISEAQEVTSEVAMALSPLTHVSRCPNSSMHSCFGFRSSFRSSCVTQWSFLLQWTGSQMTKL
eukprot:g19583.t1